VLLRSPKDGAFFDGRKCSTMVREHLNVVGGCKEKRSGAERKLRFVSRSFRNGQVMTGLMILGYASAGALKRSLQFQTG
jgi:hypothetical protein